MDKSVPEMLRDAAAIYEHRNALYGDNYKTFGKVLEALFPQGLSGGCEEGTRVRDASRLGVLIQVISKLTRYCANFEKGGHADSLTDMAVYAMMLRELDEGL